MNALLIRATIIASGNYLTQNLPDNFNDLSNDDINLFIEENVWEPLENFSPDWVYEQIAICGELMVQFLKSEQKL